MIHPPILNKNFPHWSIRASSQTWRISDLRRVNQNYRVQNFGVSIPSMNRWRMNMFWRTLNWLWDRYHSSWIWRRMIRTRYCPTCAWISDSDARMRPKMIRVSCSSRRPTTFCRRRIHSRSWRLWMMRRPEVQQPNKSSSRSSSASTEMMSTSSRRRTPKKCSNKSTSRVSITMIQVHYIYHHARNPFHQEEHQEEHGGAIRFVHQANGSDEEVEEPLEAQGWGNTTKNISQGFRKLKTQFRTDRWERREVPGERINR